jgi:hypothetical protein
LPDLSLQVHPTAQSLQVATPNTDLTRRAFLKLGATAAAAGLAGCAVPADRSGQPGAVSTRPASLSGAAAFNYIVGTQSIGATYQFTGQPLNEYSNGVENGYWLIDNQGVKQPVWHTLADSYYEARR